jgi:diguanylate cyclase (GGDEF)-like protein/PAS domain S-box-containing protein
MGDERDAGVSPLSASPDERWRLLVQNAADLISIVDRRGHLMWINPAVSRMFGWGSSELTDTDTFAFVHPEDRPHVQAVFADVLERKGAGPPVEFRALVPTGPARWIEAVMTNLLDEPSVGGVVVYVRDISERKRAERDLRNATERFRLLVEEGADFVSYRFRVVPDFACEYVSPGVGSILGLTPQDFYDNSDLWRDIVHPDDLPDVDRPVEEVEKPLTVRWRRADGTYAWLEHRRALLHDEAGQIIGVEGVGHDVTERKLAEAALQASERRFRSLVQNVSDLVTVVNGRGEIQYISPALEHMLGYTPEELRTGRPDLVHTEDLPLLAAAFQRAAPPGEAPAVTTCRTLHKDGSWRWLEYSVSDGRADPSLQGFVVVARDVTERKAAEAQLVHQALHDGLTGLPNRALFLDRLGLALSRLERRPGLAAVFFLDLDHFKVVNDSLGHSAGDQVLMAVADRLERSLRDGDTAARLGGDEFAILCDDLVDEGEAVQIAERIGAAVSSPAVPLADRGLVVTASIGVAFATHSRHRPEALLRDADAAMYRAKERGRARYELFDAAMRARAVARLETEAALRGAVEREQLSLAYQPEILLADGSLVGAEALLRWRADGDELASPADFVPVAEETGLIVPIGAWVIREACRHFSRWHRQSPERAPRSVSVNLSSRQLMRPELPDMVEQALAAAEMDPGALCLEITEGALMDDIDSAAAALKTLKAIGLRIAVDDFGTGYSSLAHLRRFPVDILKIDHSFVSGLGRNPEDAAIVRAVLGLARTLDLSVVAEGVERADQLEELRHLGCERAQGHLFSAPLAEDEFTSLLTTGS